MPALSLAQTQRFFSSVKVLARREQLTHMAPIHTDKVKRSIKAVAGEEPERAGQERSEFDLVHLARGHRELATPDGAEPPDMTVDWDVVVVGMRRAIRTQ
jgi:hypothetical protein